MQESGPPESEPAPRELAGYARTPFRAARKDPLLQRAVPLAGELRGYRPGKGRSDLIAGLTVAALAIPPARAYAERAGLHVDSGGLKALGDLSERLATDGITVRVARMKTHVHDRLEGAGIVDRIGHDHLHPTVRAAVGASTDGGV